MTAVSSTAEERLARLNSHPPEARTPFGAYLPAVQTRNLLFPSDMLAHLGPHGYGRWRRRQGKVLNVTAGREAAYTAALNAVALP